MLTVEEACEMTSMPEPHIFICCNTLETPNLQQGIFEVKVLQRGPSSSQQPMENMKLSLIGEISLGRNVLGAARLNEGSSPELLLTSQLRKSWDTLHSMEARCFFPLLLAREQAKELITNQQWLLAPTKRHCALCRFALHLVCGPSQVPL